MSKNETQHWIDYKGYAKFAETGPEMGVKVVLEELQAKIGFTFKHGNQGFPLSVVCESDGKDGAFTLHPDFIVEMPQPCWGQPQKVVEVDGIYHFTHWQQKKRRWRDSLLLKHGYDVIHIDARLAIGKWRQRELKPMLLKALVHGSPVEMIWY